MSKQRVSELRTSAAFPAPVAELKAGPVWLESSLRRFVETWERKPGRPRKDATALCAATAAAVASVPTPNISTDEPASTDEPVHR